MIYQDALLPEELEDIFINAPANPSDSVKANEKVIQKYHNITGGETTKTERKPIEGNDCPICYEEFNNAESTCYCLVCGNNLHTDCMKRWKKHNNSCPCPVCRAPNLGKDGATADTNEGYTNLSNYQPGTSRDRHFNPYYFDFDEDDEDDEDEEDEEDEDEEYDEDEDYYY